MPLACDHPALTSFSQKRGFYVQGGQLATIVLNYEGHKVCSPSDKMIITTITGSVSGPLATPTIRRTRPLPVQINKPVLYHLSEGYFVDGFDHYYSMRWNEKTNIIIDADPEIELTIWQGPAFGLNNTWSGEWSIFGYCFSP